MSGLFVAVSRAVAADDWLDDLGDQLRFVSADGGVRAKLGGSLALEGYYASAPVADLIYSDKKFLFNPRFSLALDAQVGRRLYFFAQLRADRGFDPTDEAGTEVRLDEYAMRMEVWAPGRLNVQVGKFATVVGNWVARHDAWNNPFITAPLPYDNLTGVWAGRPVPSVNTLLVWAHVRPASDGSGVYADKKFRLPVIWGPVYAPGVSVSGVSGRINYAVEIKSSGLASQPDEWDNGWNLRRPTVSARLGFQPNEMWEAGLSLSQGDYLDQAGAILLPSGLSRSDYRQRVIAQDLRFAWHHFQFWAEAYAAKFEIPLLADVSTFAYYLEAKYKFTPQFSGALRWNQQHFGDVRDLAGQAVPWGRQVWRIDVAPAFRFSAHTQVKLQYSLRHENPSPEEYTHEFAAQLMVRF